MKWLKNNNYCVNHGNNGDSNNNIQVNNNLMSFEPKAAEGRSYPTINSSE